MRPLVSLSIGSILLGLSLAGCGGGGSTNFDLNPFAGTFTGSADSSKGGVSSVNLAVSSNGTVTGTVVPTSSSGNTTTIVGTISPTGQASFTSTTTGSSTETSTGTFSINSSGILTGTLTNSDGSTVTFTISPGGGADPYTGTFSGSFTNSDGSTGTASVTINSNGGFSGTETSGSSTTNFAGTVSRTGVVSATFTTSGSSGTFTGGVAYDGAGHLVILLTNPATGLSTTITVTKSTA